MRDRMYALHTETKAQRSVHFVLEAEHEFTLWQRLFKWSGALYYKKMDRLIPYKLENVRTVYAGENLSDGYAVGADLRLNGCFVPDAESWVSVSWLRAREDICGDGRGSSRGRPTSVSRSIFSSRIISRATIPGGST